MKKIISKLALSALLLLAACGADERETEQALKPEELVDRAKEVVAIGKVLPAEGIIRIAATETAIVSEVLARKGDTLSRGDLLIILRANEAELNLAEARARLAAKLAENKAEAYNLSIEEAKLPELRQRYLTSKALMEKGAETREVLETDRSNFVQQQEKTAQARQQLKASQQSAEELKQQVSLSRLQVSDKKISAPSRGILLSLDATVGQTLEPNIVFAEISPAGELTVEAEVDELYAHKVAQGLRVLIYPTNSPTAIAEGTVSYVGASLQDKSILYEEVGEGADRRVRRITVSISKTQRELLINDKVECRILLP